MHLLILTESLRYGCESDFTNDHPVIDLSIFISMLEVLRYLPAEL